MNSINGWQVWLDYEQKLINPELFEHIKQSHGKLYTLTPYEGKVIMVRGYDGGLWSAL